MSLPTPRAQSPEALFGWAIELVQQLNLERQRADSAEQALGLVSGAACFMPGSAVPDGFYALNGQTIDRAGNPNLFATYGTSFNTGGEASDVFRLPNANGRVPKHGGAATGGASSVTIGLTHLPEVAVAITDPGHIHTANQPPHTHGVTDPGHTHSAGNYIAPGANVNVGAGGTAVRTGASATMVVGSAPTGITIQSADPTITVASAVTGISAKLMGGGQALPIDPPFFGGLWIVRAG